MAINLSSITKVVNEASQWAGLLSSMFEKAPQPIKDKLPIFLGLSREDEIRWSNYWTKLDDEQKEYLTTFLNEYCKDYERKAFRYVVVGIPADKKDVTTGSGKNKKTTTDIKEVAVDFLKQMADTIKKNGYANAYCQCIAGGIIVADPFFQKIIEKWREAVSWCKKNILETLGVESFSEITPEKISNGLKKFDNVIATRIPVPTAGKSSKKLLQITEEDIKTPGLFETIFGFKL